MFHDNKMGKMLKEMSENLNLVCFLKQVGKCFYKLKILH